MPTTTRDPAAAPRTPARTLLDLAGIAAVVGVVAVAIKLVWREFTYWGDNAESFFPLWHIYGTALRHGHLLLFDHSGWGAANVVGEAAYGVFNPVTAVNAVFISFFDRISFAGFIVMVEFLILLGWGVYALSRTYGAARVPAVIAGVVAPFAGYTLFYEAGNWASGLMSVVWVVHFWWSAHRYAQGRIGPLLPFVFGALAATVGNPYSAVGIVVVLVSVGSELLVNGRWRRFCGLVVVGLCVGATIVLTYIALVNALPQIDRPVDGPLVSNANYLSPTLSDLLALSSPTYLPRIHAWYSLHDLVPSTYLSWLVVPILPWIRWRRLGHWRENASILLATLLFVLFTLGPDHLWLFRWPLRFVEYALIGMLVLFSVILSHGLATDYRRRRVAFSVFAVAIGAYLSWASKPTPFGPNLITALGSVVFMLILAATYRRFGLRALAVLAIVGTALVSPYQAWLFGWTHQKVSLSLDQRVPGDLATLRAAAAPLKGRVLQLARLDDATGTDAVPTGQLTFGNPDRAAGVDTINRYTGIDFSAFQDAMHSDYRGNVDPAFPIARLWQPLSPEFPTPLVDALGVDTLVVQANRPDVDSLAHLPAGWRVVERTGYRVVVTRDGPLQHPALHPIGALDLTDAREEGNDLSATVSTTTGGAVLTDRLAWVGYSATIGTTPAQIRTGPFGLMVVDVPPGAHGTLHVSYTVPGLRLGVGLTAAALAGILAWQIAWSVRRRASVTAAEGVDR